MQLADLLSLDLAEWLVRDAAVAALVAGTLAFGIAVGKLQTLVALRRQRAAGETEVAVEHIRRDAPIEVEVHVAPARPASHPSLAA